MAYYREYDKVYTKEAEGIHYLNFWMVIISWIFTITMILLPRFAWFNPDVRFEYFLDKMFFDLLEYNIDENRKTINL